MDHESLKSKLHAFRDKELSADESRAVFEHLQACAACREDLASLERAVRAFFTPPSISAPADFSRSVMRRIAGQKEPRAGSFLSWLALPRWEVAAAFSVSLFILTYFSLYYLKFNEPETATAVWVERQAGSEIWILSLGQIGKEDLMRLAVWDGEAGLQDPEVEFDG